MYSRAVLLEHFQLSVLRFFAGMGAVLVAVWIRHAVLDSGSIPWAAYLLPSVIAGILVVLALWTVRAATGSGFLRRVRLSLQGVAIATAILLVLSFFYRAESYSRATVIVFIPLAGLALFIAEIVHIWILERIRANEDAAMRVLIIGHADHGRRVARSLNAEPTYMNVVGYLDEGVPGSEAADDLPILGTPDDLDSILVDERIDLAIIALDSGTDDSLQDLIGQCMRADVRWSVVPRMLGLSFDRIQIDYVGGLPIVSETGTRLVGHDWFIKRSLDVVLSGLLLIILFPFLVVTVLAIRLTSRGRAIYRQQRIGLNGRPFTLLKFRSMRTDTDTSTHRDYATQWIYGSAKDEASEGAVYKIDGDQRVTGVGRVLRATSFDEVPQLWNVFRGDMSLVGPRPPIPYEVESYTEWHRRRLAVPPGVTGLWQVTGRNHLSFDEMIKLDLDYIERWTLGLDLSILIRTVPALVMYRGR